MTGAVDTSRKRRTWLVPVYLGSKDGSTDRTGFGNFIGDAKSGGISSSRMMYLMTERQHCLIR
jgi:hypothetical protein